MISKKCLKDYEFKTIEDYYSYIVDSKINGNHSQVKDLYKKLSIDQRRAFVNWLVYNDFSDGFKAEDLII